MSARRRNPWRFRQFRRHKAASTAPAETKTPKAEPFAFAHRTWLNGNPRTKAPAFDWKVFTPEIRADVDYGRIHHPKDDSIGGTGEIFRSNAAGVTHLGVGGDIHYDHVRARLMTHSRPHRATIPATRAGSGISPTRSVTFPRRTTSWARTTQFLGIFEWLKVANWLESTTAPGETC